uniref:homeodomain-interacting protein kinase 2-like n=1 Tax=Scatophagus argus TaxID=75038 RepID=UPI001ED7DD7C|nr:homeodomain-interacting protein kinase 2-like [Scatophagus argus]
MSTTLSVVSDNFPIQEGTLLASKTSCYEVQAFLGEGSFGRVVKCVDIVTSTQVAIKITRDKPFLAERALEEIKILKKLWTLDPDKCSLVRWNGSFFHERFICLEFELLDQSLHEYTQQRQDQPLSMAEIRPVIHQLTTALLHLDDLRILHGDLKPENIMIVDRKQQPLQVKLIDFGLARHVSDAVPGSCVQSLWYRAPEVMLGMCFAEPIDMWSLGLVAAELAVGFPLFPGLHEYDMMKFIVNTLGQPPDYQLNSALKSSCFFRFDSSFKQQTWRLKSPEEFARETGHHFTDTRCYPFTSLDVFKGVMCFRNTAKENEVQNFINLLKKMLLVDKHNRIIPLKVLEHPFFSVDQHTDSSQNKNVKNLTVDMEETRPNIVTLQPSSLKKTVCSVEPVATESMTPHQETVFTQAENVFAWLEDEEDEEAHVQSEVVVEISSESEACVHAFFKRVIEAFSSCFQW